MKILYIFGTLLFLQVLVLLSVNEIINFILDKPVNGNILSEETYLENNLVLTAIIKNIIPMLGAVGIFVYGVYILVKKEIFIQSEYINSVLFKSEDSYKIFGIALIIMSLLFITATLYRVFSIFSLI